MTTIDSLDIQIAVSAGSAAAKIDALSQSLGRLRSNAKLTTVTNNLNKLAGALARLQTTHVNSGALQSLATAMNSLAGIQSLNSLNSSLRTLKKLPDIINGLDDSLLARFTDQMERLAVALRPVATMLDAVGSGFASLPAHLRHSVNALSGLNSELNETSSALNNNSINLMANISNITAFASAIQQVVQMMSGFLSQAIEWDGIQFRFGQSFGEDAEEVYNWILKINDALGINVQEFMQYSGLYASLLNGFGLAQEKVTSIAVGLTELSYDIWAFSNDRFKTLEDASEAIRSAITGEIEPIRNAGIALTEASLQEYIDSTHLAGQSIEKLTEAQKAEVRYAAMVDSAMNQGIVGTYAREMDTAEGAVRRLSQSLKTLAQAFGSLFIPLLQKVVPYVTAFVELLTDAVHWLAALFGIKIQEIDWSSTNKGLGGMADNAADVGSGLGDAADKAKKLKDYTMGFDELNVISPDTGSGAGGSGGAGTGANGWGSGLDLDSLWDQALLDEANRKVDEIKQKIKDFYDKWEWQIKVIGAALAALGISKLLSHLGTALGLGDKFLGVMKTIGKLATTAIVVTLQYTLQHELFKSFIEEGSWKDYILALVVGAIGTGIMYSMWGPAGIVIGLGVTAVAAFGAVFENGGITNTESLVTFLTGLASALGSVALGFKLLKGTDFGAFFALLREGASLGDTLAAAFPTASTVISTATRWVTTTFIPGLTSAISTGLTTVATALGVSTGWAAAIVAAIIAAIVGAIYVATHWEEVKKFFTETVPEWFSGVKESVSKWWSEFDMKETILGALGDVKEWFSGVRDDILDYWDGVIEDIESIDWADAGYNVGKNVAKAFKNAGEWFSDVWESIKTDFDTFINEELPELIDNIKEGWATWWGEKVPEIIGDMIDFFFVELPNWYEDMKEIGDEISMGILEGIKGSWDAFWEGVKEWIDGFVQGFKDELEINSPSKIFQEIGAFLIEGMLCGITEKWADIESWFTETVAPKLTLEYWQEKFSPMVEAIRTKLDEWKGAASEKWELIKEWFAENIAPIFTIEYWQEKYDTMVQAIAAKLEEWKEKAGEKWDLIKAWFAEHVAPKFTVEYWKKKFNTIVDAIKEKLSDVKKEANQKWEDIKSWFNDKIAPKLTMSYWTEKLSGLKDGIIESIGEMANTCISLINGVIGALNELANFSWDGLEIGGKTIIKGGEVTLFEIPTIPKFAGGGFIEDGLFTMNQGEIAGKFTNGKSVVANNEQIVEGISAGVYRAVMAAMAEQQNGEQAVNVYLDGKQIYASVKKHESQRGMSLMGNQLGYSY